MLTTLFGLYCLDLCHLTSHWVFWELIDCVCCTQQGLGINVSRRGLAGMLLGGALLWCVWLLPVHCASQLRHTCLHLWLMRWSLTVFECLFWSVLLMLARLAPAPTPPLAQVWRSTCRPSNHSRRPEAGAGGAAHQGRQRSGCHTGGCRAAATCCLAHLFFPHCSRVCPSPPRRACCRTPPAAFSCLTRQEISTMTLRMKNWGCIL